MNQCISRHRGFTLLEVILTLSMSVMLMVLVGSTLQFYATNMNVRDTDVRHVHLASSVLQMIGDDLRSSLYGTTFDPSTLESFLASSVAGGQSGQSGTAATSADATADPAAEEGMALEDPTATTALTSDTTDLATSAMTLTKPGLIGNQTQLQFDISRLPRVEQWTQALETNPGVMTDVPSDLKTVTYYVQAPGTVGGVVDPVQGYLPTANPAAPTANGGLVRRELDRAATNWSMEIGGISGLMMTGELIASEVLDIQFEYFDGIIWQIMWNSDEMGSMPRAIRITLTMTDPNNSTTDAALTGVEPGTRTFVHTVLLPVGAAAAQTTDTLGTDGSTGAATGTTTGTTGAAGTSTTGTSSTGGAL